MTTCPEGPFLLWGMGATNRAVATALHRRGWKFIAVDDAPAAGSRRATSTAGGVLQSPPGNGELTGLMERCGSFLPTPGLPDRHRAMQAAAEVGTVVLSEFDLAAAWDDRPVVAVTGTNGKTTVTTLVAAALAPSTGAVAAGNNDVPLVTAIDDPSPAVFVAEASSFRLSRSRSFRPRVAAWLNFAPDHLDVHASREAYEEAKARIWRNLGPDDVAVLNAGDPVVAARRPAAGRMLTFGTPASDVAVAGGSLVVCGDPLVEIEALPRRFPHDLRNAEAAAACAVAAGVPAGDLRDALESFRGLPHRLELVAQTETNRWYDDSKATTPDAVLAAVGGFESVVLIAGGRNKGLDLQTMASAASVRAVVAIGEASGEVCAAFAGSRPVQAVRDMETAVSVAGDMALVGEAILLSPGCTSFDWYDSYRQRGEHFAALVRCAVGEGERR